MIYDEITKNMVTNTSSYSQYGKVQTFASTKIIVNDQGNWGIDIVFVD